MISFIVKQNTQVNIFQNIKKKHGKDIICVARKLEDLINKHTKIQLNTNFIKTCKRKDSIPTFAKVNVTIKHGAPLSKVKIGSTVMEAEVENKHDQKRRLIKKFVISS